MSTIEVSKILKDLYELRAMRTELDDEITALEDRVKAEMNARGVDELEGAGHIAKYSEYTTMRFDAFRTIKKHLKKCLKDVKRERKMNDF